MREDRRYVSNFLQEVEDALQPIVNDARAELRRFTLAELQLIEKFLRRALDNQKRHASRLRSEST